LAATKSQPGKRQMPVLNSATRQGCRDKNAPPKGVTQGKS
jgi:hypothetical protein